MADEVTTTIIKLSNMLDSICNDESKTSQEKVILFTSFRLDHQDDFYKIVEADSELAQNIFTKVDNYISAFQNKITTEIVIKRKKEIDIPAEYNDLGLDKDQLKNKQYINEIVPTLLRSDHRVGYIMLCIYSKLKPEISNHITDIINKLKDDQTLDFSYPPFYLDYPNNNINVNSLNDLFVYTHIGLYYYGKLYPGEQNIQIFNNVLNRVLTHDIVDYSDKSFVTDNLKTLQFSNDDGNKLKFQQIFTNICCCILSPGIKNNIVIHS